LSELASKLKAEDPTRDFNLVGILKEVSNSEEEDNLGIREFHEDFFKGGELYLDSKRDFYRALGHGKFRTMGLSNFFSWSFIKNFIDLKKKGVDGNMVGEGSIQGGVFVIGPGEQGVIYAHQEITGQLPSEFIDEVESAMREMDGMSSCDKSIAPSY